MKKIGILMIPVFAACAATQQDSIQSERECEKVVPTGSHMAQVVCKTEEQKKKEKDEARENILRMQRDGTAIGR